MTKQTKQRLEDLERTAANYVWLRRDLDDLTERFYSLLSHLNLELYNNPSVSRVAFRKKAGS